MQQMQNIATSDPGICQSVTWLHLANGWMDHSPACGDTKKYSIIQESWFHYGFNVALAKLPWPLVHCISSRCQLITIFQCQKSWHKLVDGTELANINTCIVFKQCSKLYTLIKFSSFSVGIVELCAKILQIMRNDFKDYTRAFCQLCAPFSVLYCT